MIENLTPELRDNESLKGFNSPDDLGKAYLDLHTRASAKSLDFISEDLRKEPSMANFKTLDDVAKGFVETKKLVGTIKRPPAKPEEYSFSPVDGVAIKADPEFQKVLANELYKTGAPQEVVDAAHRTSVAYVDRLIKAQQKATEENRQKNEAALKLEWGADYDKKFNSTVRMLQAVGGDELIKELGPQLKNAPLALKGFAKIASLIGEDSLTNLGSGAPSTGEEAEEKEYQSYRNAIATNDQKNPLMNEKDPKHTDAVRRYNDLSTKHFTRQK